MAPAPPESSSDNSPKRLMGSDATVSASASGSVRSVSGLRSSSVSCRRSRLTVICLLLGSPMSGGQKKPPLPVRGLGGNSGPARQTASCTARTSAVKSATLSYHFYITRQAFRGRTLSGLLRRAPDARDQWTNEALPRDVTLVCHATRLCRRRHERSVITTPLRGSLFLW